MFVITKEGVADLQKRILHSGATEGCRDELSRILEIKDTLLWRAEKACACVGQTFGYHLTCEVEILQKALDALTEGNNIEAAALLGEYLSNWSQKFDESE